MKKIGIITHYYHSSNYGGNLQAHALVQFLRANGYDAEQISYDRRDEKMGTHRPWYKTLRSGLKTAVVKCMNRPIVQKRNAAIGAFNKAIAHSPTVTYRGIGELAKKYDVLISGSDQVWHPQAVCRAYLLDFETNAKRLSYAASFATYTIPDGQKKLYSESLKKFDAISVREDAGIDLVQQLAQRDSVKVLDPTMLLPAESWDALCETIEIPEKYLFCYFLGASEQQRESAVQYARAHDLKIVTLPHLSGRKRSCDVGFGDAQLLAVSPGQLLYLIKNAECVMTDSFHVTLFSLVFRKNFITLERVQHEEMSSRVHSLLSLFELEDRFCLKDDMEQICTMAPVCYREQYPKFESERQKSIDFLLNNIECD